MEGRKGGRKEIKKERKKGKKRKEKNSIMVEPTTKFYKKKLQNELQMETKHSECHSC
jgi:hypothetical protein